MEAVSLTELKLIHSRNNILSQKKPNKINNLKKIYSYKARYLKGNLKIKFPINIKKANSILYKNCIISNPKDINNQTPLNKHHSFNFRYIKQKIPLKFSLYTVLAMKKNNIYDKIEKIIQPENYKVNKFNNINIFKNKEFVP